MQVLIIFIKFKIKMLVLESSLTEVITILHLKNINPQLRVSNIIKIPISNFE